jgi:hypothetical protein
LLDGLLVGLEDAEALVVGLSRVLAYEVDQGALVAAAGGGDLDAMADFLGEYVGENRAVGEVDGKKDRARDVGLVELELLEESGEEGRGAERLAGFVDG